MAGEIANGKWTQLQSGKYDPTTGFYIQDASGRAIAVRDGETGRILSQDEEADYVRNNKSLNTTWEQIKQAQAPAATPTADVAPAPAPDTPDAPPPPPTSGGGSPAMMGLQAAASAPGAGWGADSAAGGGGASSLGQRTPPAAVTTLSEIVRRFGRTY